VLSRAQKKMIGETVEVMPWALIYFSALLIGYGVLAIIFLIGAWIFVGFVQELIQNVYRKPKTK
jgi:hypothetical protein